MFTKNREAKVSKIIEKIRFQSLISPEFIENRKKIKESWQYLAILICLASRISIRFRIRKERLNSSFKTFSIFVLSMRFIGKVKMKLKFKKEFTQLISSKCVYEINLDK